MKRNIYVTKLNVEISCDVGNKLVQWKVGEQVDLKSLVTTNTSQGTKKTGGSKEFLRTLLMNVKRIQNSKAEQSES